MKPTGPVSSRSRRRRLAKRPAILHTRLKRNDRKRPCPRLCRVACATRPFRLLFTQQPIIQVLTLYMAYIYGLMYLLLSTFPLLWTSPKYYGESVGIGGLNYISLGLGSLVGTYLCAWLLGIYYMYSGWSFHCRLDSPDPRTLDRRQHRRLFIRCRENDDLSVHADLYCGRIRDLQPARWPQYQFYDV